MSAVFLGAFRGEGAPRFPRNLKRHFYLHEIYKLDNLS